MGYLRQSPRHRLRGFARPAPTPATEALLSREWAFRPAVVWRGCTMAVFSNLGAESLDPDPEVLDAAGPCNVIQERLRRSNNWLDAFTFLVWIVALAAAVMLVTAIILAMDKNIPGTIASGVGTVLSSTGFGVLLKLKSAQQRELNMYLKKSKDQGCPQ